MSHALNLLRQGRHDELWTKYCGFLDLTKEQFMVIQERLLKEQCQLLGQSSLGQRLLGSPIPATMEEFRQRVPLTTYEDYSPELTDKDDDALAVKPLAWTRTSGRSSAAGPKWIPYTQANYDYMRDVVVGGLILSSARHKGDVRLQQRDRMLMTTAPLPYMSGLISRATEDALGIHFLPPLEEAEKMEFAERIAQGFRLSMREGMDYFYGIASILTRIGEQFQTNPASSSPSRDMLHPAILWRLFKAVFSTRIQNRPMLPKDIWKLKGISTGGSDTEVYKEKIKKYWGRTPLEGYACTEGGLMAMQAWNYGGLYFFPDSNFIEFIPQAELEKEADTPGYQPQPVLYNEVEPGIYELVFTNFHGGALVRYRIGDYFEIVALEDEELGNNLPQARFYSRSTDLIDLASFVRLTEKDIWRAVEDSGLDYTDWIARKEIIDQEPSLHIYIEPKTEEHPKVEEAHELINQQLRTAITEYADFFTILDRDPLHFSWLPIGAHDHYMKTQREAGADLAHTKPPHMQPREDILERLLTYQKET